MRCRVLTLTPGRQLKVDHAVSAAGTQGGDPFVGIALAQFFQVLLLFLLLLAAVIAMNMPAPGAFGPTFFGFSCMAA